MTISSKAMLDTWCMDEYTTSVKETSWQIIGTGRFLEMKELEALSYAVIKENVIR